MTKGEIQVPGDSAEFGGDSLCHTSLNYLEHSAVQCSRELSASALIHAQCMRAPCATALLTTIQCADSPARGPCGSNFLSQRNLPHLASTSILVVFSSFCWQEKHHTNLIFLGSTPLFVIMLIFAFTMLNGRGKV